MSLAASIYSSGVIRIIFFFSQKIKFYKDVIDFEFDDILFCV